MASLLSDEQYRRVVIDYGLPHHASVGDLIDLYERLLEWQQAQPAIRHVSMNAGPSDVYISAMFGEPVEQFETDRRIGALTSALARAEVQRDSWYSLWCRQRGWNPITIARHPLLQPRLVGDDRDDEDEW